MRNQVFVLWYGGCSYSSPSIPEDVERFDSLADAKYAFAERYRSGGWHTCAFRYVNRAHEPVLLPAVDESTTEMSVYYGDPTEAVDPYPDLRLTFGPRGGVRAERC